MLEQFRLAAAAFVGHQLAHVADRHVGLDRERLQNFDTDWSLEQMVTEALIEIEEERAAGASSGPSSLRGGILADKTGR
jgi:hypothetical protein